MSSEKVCGNDEWYHGLVKQTSKMAVGLAREASRCQSKGLGSARGFGWLKSILEYFRILKGISHLAEPIIQAKNIVLLCSSNLPLSPPQTPTQTKQLNTMASTLNSMLQMRTLPLPNSSEKIFREDPIRIATKLSSESKQPSFSSIHNLINSNEDLAVDFQQALKYKSNSYHPYHRSIKTSDILNIQHKQQQSTTTTTTTSSSIPSSPISSSRSTPTRSPSPSSSSSLLDHPNLLYLLCSSVSALNEEDNLLLSPSSDDQTPPQSPLISSGNRTSPSTSPNHLVGSKLNQQNNQNNNISSSPTNINNNNNNNNNTNTNNNNPNSNYIYYFNNRISTPIDYFRKVFGNVLEELTNKISDVRNNTTGSGSTTQSNSTHYLGNRFPITVSLIESFIVVSLFINSHSLERISDYWSTARARSFPDVALIPRILSRNKYFEIKSCLSTVLTPQLLDTLQNILRRDVTAFSNQLASANPSAGSVVPTNASSMESTMFRTSVKHRNSTKELASFNLMLEYGLSNVTDFFNHIRPSQHISIVQLIEMLTEQVCPISEGQPPFISESNNNNNNNNNSNNSNLELLNQMRQQQQPTSSLVYNQQPTLNNNINNQNTSNNNTNNNNNNNTNNTSSTPNIFTHNNFHILLQHHSSTPDSLKNCFVCKQSSSTTSATYKCSKCLLPYHKDCFTNSHE
ncbi:hypothetical protein DFA_07390 [Cavenderia fasciculata]|uniref:Uncharacterized protein n=1 Tax=Cavenderia fasciculata TaxID=261658 RepID=F4PWA3_CACFS|nr:uncharacterized protein DFA_07390 [Cavenderia fasciculata]EGG20267.1 hypothetical protein DFA_07390 [Cavenderia fasciculata]|eukprot:XP_004367250.1 hypothetical protein DFA_07390 [Cavenderia fasciculata]